MENKKMNKMELLAKRMQAYLDNFSKDNRKNNIDRRNYKKTGKRLSIEYVTEKAFNALLKRRGYGDMSFKGTPDMGDRVTAIYENSLKQEKMQQGEER